MKALAGRVKNMRSRPKCKPQSNGQAEGCAQKEKDMPNRRSVLEHRVVSSDSV